MGLFHQGFAHLLDEVVDEEVLLALRDDQGSQSELPQQRFLRELESRVLWLTPADQCGRSA